MTPRVWLAVGAGGAAGTLARISIDPAIITGSEPNVWLIFLVNLVGAGALGVVTGHGLPRLSDNLRVALTTGFIGSFTTFSAITTIWLVFTLGNSALLGAVYLLGTLATGVAVAFVGLSVGHRWQQATATREVAGHG
jgi:CrcB protein